MIPSTLKKNINLSRVEQVVNYIETNLTEDLSLDKLAAQATVSPFHFHRIFSQITGETTHEFVQRKRIELIATRLLKFPNATIKDLCMRYGFDNPVSFSRAFKKFYGVSASALRKKSQSKGLKLIRKKSKIGKDQLKADRYLARVEDGIQWISAHGSVMIRDVDRFKIAYIRNRGPFELTVRCFENLAEWASAHPGLASQKNKWILIIHDNPDLTEDVKMMQSAGLIVDQEYSMNGEVNFMTIPAGRFLVGHLSIKDEDIKYAWDSMSSILLSGNYVLRDGYFFEIFLNDSLFAPGQTSEIEIFLPIE